MMNYKVGDDVTDGKSTGTVVAINGGQLQIHWTAPSEYERTTWINALLVSPAHTCETCKYHSLELMSKPCVDCDSNGNHWEGSAVNQQHYIDSAMQPVQVMQVLLTPEQFIGFCMGNCVKYRMRCDHKGQHDSDIGKALQYAYWADMAKQGKRIDPAVDVPPKDYEWKGI